MLSYAALGMREGVLIELSKQKCDDTRQPAIYSSAIIFAIAVGILLPIGYSLYALTTGAAFDANYLLVFLVGGVTILNEVLINLNRYESNLKRVAFCEVSYNVVILGLIFALYKIISVPLVLMYMLAAISLSSAIYLTRLRFFSLSSVSLAVIRRLVATGYPSSLLSGLLIILNLLFILVAQRHLPKDEVGQFVFANNIATLLMVSLNAFSWAMTSRSMNDLASAQEEEMRKLSILRTDMYMRVGLAAALFLAALTAVVLPWFTVRYADAGRYVTLFVALQSFQLIIFMELNYLMLKNRIAPLIGIFICVNLVNYALIESLSAHWPFYFVMIGAIVCSALGTIAVMKYAMRAGLDTIRGGARYGSLTGILVVVILFFAMGVGVTLVVAAFLLGLVIYANRKQLLLIHA
jgi:O-antigen/teichoic acid export membrane protein